MSKSEPKLVKRPLELSDQQSIDFLQGGFVRCGKDGHIQPAPEFSFSGSIDVVNCPGLYDHIQETMNNVQDPNKNSPENYANLEVTIMIGNRTIRGAHVNMLGNITDNCFTFGFH